MSQEEGVTMSTSEAEYQKVLCAVESGEKQAKTKLAWFKLSGDGGAEIDENPAVALLHERVKDDDSDAMWMLGLCYEFGRGCKQDLVQADHFYQQSYRSGNQIGELFSLWVDIVQNRGSYSFKVGWCLLS